MRANSHTFIFLILVSAGLVVGSFLGGFISAAQDERSAEIARQVMQNGCR